MTTPQPIGRPATGRTVRTLAVSLPLPLVAALERAREPGEPLSRQVAALLTAALQAQGALPPEPDRLAAIEASLARIEARLGAAETAKTATTALPA